MNSTAIVVQLSVDIPSLVAVLVCLAVFGIFYNLLVQRLGDQHEGYTALLVVVGVAITGIGFGVLAGLGNLILMVACFIASGLPMIVGEIARYVNKRNKTQREVEQWLERARLVTAQPEK